jgi:hypothetical protein
MEEYFRLVPKRANVFRGTVWVQNRVQDIANLLVYFYGNKFSTVEQIVLCWRLDAV